MESSLPVKRTDGAEAKLAHDPPTDDESEPEIRADRRLRQSKLVAWISSNQERLEDPARELATDEQSSVRNLVHQDDSAKIINRPREYQLELFEKAKERNIIAELEDRARGKQKRISFFVVNSVSLLFQQYAVLECNLDQRVSHFCGEMGCDLWSKETWQKHFDENMIIACTADVLYQCLHHAFISIPDINLLIFDEAHHAKKNHGYARIIRDFYNHADRDQQPRIFGMTASPVNSKTDIRKAATELETILNSQILTVKDPSAMARTFRRLVPNEVLEYDTLDLPNSTPLTTKISAMCGTVPEVSKACIRSMENYSQLGPWCADQVWRVVLTEDQVRRLEARIQSRHHRQRVEFLADTETQLENIRAARNLVATHSFEAPAFSRSDLSPKAIRLIEFLREAYSHPSHDRCIIFVKERLTAILLTMLLADPKICTPNLRVGSYVGAGSVSFGPGVSLKDQIVTMSRFRKGQLNCLVATSVAEEGIDIPDCNTVIRFELCQTVIQYIQSRGRARQANSRYIHLVERENSFHTGQVEEAVYNEQKLREFCCGLPSDRLLDDNRNLELVFQDSECEQHVEPSTGATLTYRVSLTTIANFASSLPYASSVGDSPHSPSYYMMFRNGSFISEVILPDVSPIHSAIGAPARSKGLAKCAAAFAACVKLRKGGFLDENFIPIYRKKLPLMRNAALSLDVKKEKGFDMRRKPEIWTRDATEHFFMAAIVPEGKGIRGHACYPIGLLTRHPVPQLPKIPVFLGPENTVVVNVVSSSQRVQLLPELVSQLNEFTLRVFRDVFSKDYEPNEAKMPYFLVPLRSELQSDLQSFLSQQSSVIDLDSLRFVSQNQTLPWDGQPAEFFSNKYLTDPCDGSFKVWVSGVSNLKPTDKVPEDVHARTRSKHSVESIMQYSCSVGGKGRREAQYDPDQPVLEGEIMTLQRNFLDEGHTADLSRKKCFVIPEPLTVSAIPSGYISTAYLFPSVISRVESYLVTLDLCEHLHLRIQPALALEALTKDTIYTKDVDAEQAKGAITVNYERLEFLGDCFLKMATTIALFTNTDDDEFTYHVERMLMICNRNLLKTALQHKVFEFIRSYTFNRRAWYPEGLVLKHGKAGDLPSSHSLGDKTIADVCEALIGAALLSHPDMDMAVQAVTVFVDNPNHSMQKFGDYYDLYTPPEYLSMRVTAAQRDLVESVERAHPYHFQHARLLRSAFIHPSYQFMTEMIPNYQRLEFLGDALFDMVCVGYLFRHHPDRDPQWLTEHKTAMVSNQFLAALCVKMGFHRKLIHMDDALPKQIHEYEADLTIAREEAETEAVAAGEDRASYRRDYWVNSSKPPKCLADIVEAYIGALFVDSQYNFAEVERFFDAHVKWFFEDITIYDTYASKHPISQLQKLLGERLRCTDWNIVTRELPAPGPGLSTQIVAAVMIHGEVVEGIQADTVRSAKAQVADQVLASVKKLSSFDFRKEYGCNCKFEAPGEAAQTKA